jgi:hypothetical protein
MGEATRNSINSPGKGITHFLAQMELIRPLNRMEPEP